MLFSEDNILLQKWSVGRMDSYSSGQRSCQSGLEGELLSYSPAEPPPFTFRTKSHFAE